MREVFTENRYFLRFWLARIISQVGDGIHALAILWLSYHWSHSAMVVGWVMIAVSLPGILVSPLAGNLADRIDRRKIMVAADLVRMVCVGFLALLSYTHVLNLPILMAVTVLISLASAHFNPSAMALLPQMVSSQYLTKANALVQISSSFSIVMGPALGMGIIAAIGVATAFALNALSFLASAILIGGITVDASRAPTTQENIWKTMKDGFSLLAKYPIVYKMLDKTAIINFFFCAITIVIPVLAEGIYKRGAKGMGLMMTFFGLGMFCASLFLSFKQLKQSIKLRLMLALSLMGISFILFGIVQVFPVSLLSLFLIGFFLNFTNVNLITLYQQSLPNDVLGRIMAFISAISLSLQPLSYGVMGMLVGLLGVKWVLVISGLVILASTFRIHFVRELGGYHGEMGPI